jgi:hypothetical protein
MRYTLPPQVSILVAWECCFAMHSRLARTAPGQQRRSAFVRFRGKADIEWQNRLGGPQERQLISFTCQP